ncbi:hypothetical protein D5038_17075 [Verminephrobacter aporrectodeae subsp. tuberculatae]|uniref:Ig-like domain-containing protein n=4 Tax=Verminephrobacter aporrectodeae TaxID=1110389 RepID=UPI00223808F7|nr:Ig-like domain-containing protein [Verminephrobacter aporrectodeae]MCW5258010.1 hypothetical protein [Verminephrobacter aporrectodeae subsp. tuberculatae]
MAITSVSIRADKYKLGKGESTTVHFRFNETPRHVAFNLVDDCTTMPSGTRWTSGLTRDPDDSRHYWATLSADDNREDCGGRITIEHINLIADETGDAGSGVSQSDWISVDTVNPRLERITLDDTNLQIGKTTRVRFVFNEIVSVASVRAAIDLSNAHGTLGDLYSITGGDTWIAIFTPTAHTANTADCKIGLNVSQVRDLHGNAGQDSSGGSNPVYSGNYTVNTWNPALNAITSVNIRLESHTLVSDASIVVHFEFNQAPLASSFTLSDVVLPRGIGWRGELRQDPGDAKHFSATMVPTMNGHFNARVSLDLARVTNAGGHQGSGVFHSAEFAFDNILPHLRIITVSDSYLGAGETATVTFLFDEAIANFTIDQIDLSNAHGTLSAPTRNQDGKTWTAIFTPTANVSDTTNTISVDMGTVRDLAGNAGTGRVTGSNFQVRTTESASSMQTTTVTAVNIWLEGDVLRAGVNLVVHFEFNGWPLESSFTLSDVVLPRALDWVGSLSRDPNNAKHFYATLGTGYLVENSDNRIFLDLAHVTDADGHQGSGIGWSRYFVSDTIRPLLDSITVAGLRFDAEGRATLAVTFSFAEEITDFGTDDVDLSDTHGTLSALTRGSDGRFWNATLTVPANTNDTSNTISVNMSGLRDLAGNTGEDRFTSSNFQLDTTGPSATITLAQNTLKFGETTTVTFRFNQAVTDFTSDDVVLTHASGTLGALTALGSDGKTWTAIFTPQAITNATTGSIGMNLAGVRSTAGKAGIGYASSANYTVDTLPPSATIHLADSRLTVGETTTVRFVFNEPVTGFDASDVDLSDANGTLGPLSADADGRTWSAPFTPTANVEDASNTIRVNLTGVTDATGNAGIGSVSSPNYTIATRGPVATITLADTSLTVGQTTTAIFLFNTLTTGFTADDIDLIEANGTLGELMPFADGKTWTAIFTPTANLANVRNRIIVNLSGVIDAATGLAGSGRAASADYAIDTTTVHPTARITLADSSLAIGDTTLVTFRFSERVNGFTADDVVLTDANGTLGPLTADPDGKTWTATFTPAANTENSSNTIGVNLAGVTNAAGRAGVGQSTSFGYLIDTRQPTVRSLAIADAQLGIGESTTVTLTFSEALNQSSLALADLSLSNLYGQWSSENNRGALSNLRTSDGISWQITLTAPTSGSSSADNLISLRQRFTDVAGNTGPRDSRSFSEVLYSIDLVRPSATIALADSSLTVGESTRVTFRFSEPVTDFTMDDIVLSDANGTLSAFTADTDGRTWTALFTPTANVNDATNTLRVNLGGVRDIAGNTGEGQATSASYAVDTIDPTRPYATTITLADSVLTAGETTTVSFHFSESVTGFTMDDIVLSDANGTLSALNSTDGGRTWSAVFTPAPNVNDSSNTISVNLAGVTNAAGRAGVGHSRSASYSVDTRDTSAPTATITLADTALTAGETTTVSIRFNEPVTGFDASDVVLTDANGTLGALTPNAERTLWTATFTPTDKVGDATNTISVNLAGVRDDAGNAGVGTASSANYSVDTRDTSAPTATITLADTALTAGETTTVSIRFNEPVTGLDASDVVLTAANGTLGALTPNAERTLWTATFTPTDKVSALVNTIRVNLAGVRDDAGNAGVGSASSTNYSVDTVRPTATITLADSALTAGESTTVNITFNEPVTGFDASDIVLTDANGTLGALTPNAERTLWTATFTPTADTNVRANTIRVNLAGVRDDAGNAGTGNASSTNYSVDTVRPTATITLADIALTRGQTTTVSIRFNEPVTGFDASDIVLTDANGTLGALTPNAERTLWTATFTPTDKVGDATNTISVNLAGVADAAGNAGVGTASSANYSVDTRDTSAPTATITLANTALIAGQTTTVSFRFNEPVTGFDASDIVLTDANGTLGALTPNAERTLWTATFTPTDKVGDATNTISVNLAGVADAAGNAGVGTASSANYSVDTRDTSAPTATITLANTALIAGQTTTVSFRFNEPVTGFDASDIVLTDANGTLGALTPNAERTLWTATLTPNANANDAANTISVNLAGVRDDAGNAGTGSASSANYSVDTVRPTATITLADSALTVDETTTVSFRFNKPVNGFDTDDIVYTNGTLTTPTANAARTVWTATYTPAEDISARVNTIRVNLAGVTDDAGNTGTGSAISANYSVDNTRPTATSITLADSALTAGETTTVTFRFNEPVNGLDTSDIVCPNGRLSTPVANAERTLWTATLTPNAHANARTNAIRVDLTGVTDDAGNAGTGRASSTNYSVHTTRPTATITLADSTLTAGESTTVRFIFNEPVNGLDTSDIVCPNGRLSPPTANAERTLWTATLTPNAGANAATNTIRVDLAGVTNDTGNAGTGSASSTNYSVDTVRPTATIALADNALTVDETTTVSFRFNEPVTGFDANDIVLTEANGTLGTLTHNAERTVWTATFTPTANVSALANTIRVNLSGVSDDAGNAGTGSASSTNYSVDTVRPTATITLADSTLTAGESTTVSFRFNEPVTGLDASDIMCTSGTLSPPTANAERTVWTATFTPTANVSAGANTIRVNLSGVSDDAGNAGTGSASSTNYSVDTERPTATITLADSTLTAGESTTVSFRFSEPVTGFDTSDIVCTSGTLSPPTANAERTVWTATFTPTANVSVLTNTIRVNLANVSDDAGNAGTDTASSNNYSVDTTRPTATIALADSALTAGKTTTVSFRFSEPVTGLDPSDIVLTDANGTLTTPTANTDRTLWTATFTPTANVSALTNTIRVNLAHVSDDAGNAGTDTASSNNYSVDTTRPTATIALADSRLTAGETTAVTITFSEPVTGLDASDIVCPNGTLSTPTANTERTVWTATFTPTANVSAGANTIRVNLSGVRDDAGNAGTGSASSDNYSVDTRPADTTGPTATITLADSALTAGKTTTVTITFSEPVNGLDPSDIVSPGGTLSPPTANAERTVWTATFTPTANVSVRANTIHINLGGVRDDAGNTGTGSASSDNYSVDTTRPTATITLADSTLTAGESTTVTITFSEPITGLDPSDIVCPGGTLSPPTANAERTVWTATFTPTANVNAGTNTIRVNLAHVRDDAGNAGTDTASSTSYSVNTTRPTATIALADNALTAGESTTVTITFSEPVNGLDPSDIVCTSGTLSPPTTNTERTVWIATFTPTANVSAGENTIRVNLAGVTNDAGNAGTGSASSANYSVDTRPANTTGPTATIALADTQLTVGETTTVTIAFNEPVTDFTRDDLVLSNANGTFTDPTTNDQGRTWTATFTPTAGVENNSNTISVNQEGVRNAAGRAGTGHAHSARYQIDTRAPVLASATVNASQLVLRYTEGTSLDATHIPPTTAFTVRIDNVLTAVTAIAVGAQEKTVSLTLATAVTNGQAVTIAYTDPTTGNDANAIQDAAGNDAASFAAMPVDNHTPAPPTPGPGPTPPGPAPSPSPPEGPAPKDTKDTDGDSIPDSIEDPTPGISGPSGAAPVTGDGNGDGVQDSTQAAVGSTRVTVRPIGGESASSTPVTLVVGSQDGKLDPDSGARITRLEQKDAPAQLPQAMEMPLGLLRFEARLATGRSSETFSLYLDPALGVGGYWVKDGTDTWVNLSSAPYGGKMASEGGRLRLDFAITDGGPFDADGQANGAITAPGAAAQMPLSIVGQASDGAAGDLWL